MDSGYVKSASCNCKANALGRCSHVAAVLLLLSDHVSESGTVVVVPSTSKPCSWNEGKKRGKNPKALHDASYSSRSKRRVAAKTLLEFDPRPVMSKGHPSGKAGLTKFITSMQSGSSDTMWEAVLRIPYSDFLDSIDKDILNVQVDQFIEHLQVQCDSLCGNNDSAVVPETIEQSESQEWFSQRWGRITASVCKAIAAMGTGILLPQPEQWKQRLYNHLHDSFWNKEHFLTADIAYGITEEPAARDAYNAATGDLVIVTGLWITKLHPHLGASPDGLIVRDGVAVGIVEIKCLKVLRYNSVEDVVHWMQADVLDEEMKKLLRRQCFECVDGKLVLKKKHMYYFQVQMLLLVTGFQHCDFVLHSKKSGPSIQRILADLPLQQQIIAATRVFWKQVS